MSFETIVSSGVTTDEFLNLFKKSEKFKHITEKDVEGIHNYLAIRDYDQLIAFVTFEDYRECKRSWTRSFKLDNCLCISELLVDPEYRRRGYGKYLVSEVVRHAVNEGFDRLILSVTQDNDPAQSLYQKVGFTHAGSYNYGIIKLILDIFTFEVPRPLTRRRAKALGL